MEVQKIREQQGLDAVLLFAPEEILAAAEIHSRKSCLVADEQGLVLICPEGTEGREEAAGLSCLTYAEVGFAHVEYAEENFWKRIREKLSGRHRIGVNAFSCPVALASGSGPGMEYRDISREIVQAMMCKRPSFFERYEEAAALNRAAYDRIRETIRPGSSEQEAARQVREVYVSAAAGQVLYGGDFLSGSRTLQISGPATERIIRLGDPFIADIQCMYAGAGCDTTRSFFCQEPTGEQERVYRFLTEVQEEAAKLLRPGVAAGDIYRYINQRFLEEGYAGLAHHAGHGLGYRWYEAPYLIEACGTILQEDMLVALEPGIYLPGLFGLRIENNYRVTRDGGVDLFHYKRKLEDFIIG